MPWGRVLEREFRRSSTSWRLFESSEQAESWAHRLALELGDTGVTWASALLAETGSVVLRGDDGQLRAASLLVRHHIVLARAADIHQDLASYLATLPAPLLHESVGSHLTLITGPSRTADIEKTLVIPAHGPATLRVGIVV